MYIRDLLLEWYQDIFPTCTGIVWDKNEVVSEFLQRRFELFKPSDLALAHSEVFDRFLDPNSDSFVSDNSLHSAVFDLFEDCEVFLLKKT